MKGRIPWLACRHSSTHVFTGHLVLAIVETVPGKGSFRNNRTYTPFSTAHKLVTVKQQLALNQKFGIPFRLTIITEGQQKLAGTEWSAPTACQVLLRSRVNQTEEGPSGPWAAWSREPLSQAHAGNTHIPALGALS